MALIKRRWWLVGTALAGTFIAGVGFWWFGSIGQSDLYAPTPERIANGQPIYDRHCASCHGAHLEGQPDWQHRLATGRLPAPPHDATGHTWHHPDEELFVITKEGPSGVVPGYVSDMPAFEGVLSDRQIRDVLVFIKSQWPPEIAARQKQINDAFERNGR